MAASTVGPPRGGIVTMVLSQVLNRWRSRDGSTCSTLLNAGSDASSIPATLLTAPVCSPIVTATASSSSATTRGARRLHRAGNRRSGPSRHVPDTQLAHLNVASDRSGRDGQAFGILGA
jgi:hypothetical protein